MLKFLGLGSAFNPSIGNTSAYFEHNKQLVLLDCGETVFSKLLETDLLERNDIIHVLTTHSHADHIGSLATLILYVKYKLNKKLYLYSNYKTDVPFVLKLMGCSPGSEYIHRELDCIMKNNFDFMEIHLVKNEHDPNITSFGFIIKLPNNKRIYYSGDSMNIKDYILKEFKHDKTIDAIYQDVAHLEKSRFNIHMSLEEISEVIEPEYRENVYLMHFNEEMMKSNYNEILKKGFNVPEMHTSSDLFIDLKK